MTSGLVAGGSAPAAPERAEEPAPQILVFDNTGELGVIVEEAVADLPQVPEVTLCTAPKDLVNQFATRRFDLMVAGPGLDTPSGLERLRIIREELPRLVVVLAVSSLAGADVKALVRSGAADLIDLPAKADDLVEPLERALMLSRRIINPGASSTGAAIEHVPVGGIGRRVITIASASGGCGKTFLATNLAWFLSHHGHRRVCIVDLDLQFGEVTSSMRLRPRYTITDLISQSEGTDGNLEDHFVEFCERHESGIHVLAAPRDPTEAAMLRPEDIGRVIDAARANFDDVIIDTPPVLADSVVVAFNRSDELFVMATLDIPSIRNMQVFLGTLERLHVSSEGLRLVLNKAEDDAGVEVRQVLKLFPQGFESTLPYSRDVARSINAGKPVLTSAPASDISRRIRGGFKRLLPPNTLQEFQEYEASLRPSRLRIFGRKER